MPGPGEGGAPSSGRGREEDKAGVRNNGAPAADNSAPKAEELGKQRGRELRRAQDGRETKGVGGSIQKESRDDDNRPAQQPLFCWITPSEPTIG